MSKGEFVKGTTVTITSNLINLLVGMVSSIILARCLGPEGRGIYALAMLLPSLIINLGNLGIGPATVYYVARREFRPQVVLGNNILLSLAISGICVIAGLITILFFGETLFPGIPHLFLLISLFLIPVEIVFSNVRHIFLGAQRIKEYNYVQIVHSLINCLFIALALLWLRSWVIGAIIAVVGAWFIADILIFWFAKKMSGGVSFALSFSYIKKTIDYGFQAHLANIMGFLNYRIDMFLVNGFLGPVSVGFYSIGVGLVEKLWLISQAAATVLFPRVAAETEEQKRVEFTALVARTVLWLTLIGGLFLVICSRWIITILYSKDYLPATGALQALLTGIIALSAGRVLGNDIAGRGRPILNAYRGIVSIIINVVLNILLIPRYGIVGAAWATTFSYTVSFFMSIFFFCRLSGTQWTKVVFLQPSDWLVYKKLIQDFYQWARLKIRMINNDKTQSGR